MISVSESPYRSTAASIARTLIDAQMRGAIRILKKWRWHDVALAGGALWSWAAGEPARDVDFFVRSTFWTRRKARSLYVEAEPGLALSSRYQSLAEGTVINNFKTQLHDCPTPVDFVISHRPRTVDGGIFDYTHCCVAYALKWYCIDGANAYAEGRLTKLHFDARKPDYVLSKVRRSLWGNPSAPDKLMEVMSKLSDLSGRPLRSRMSTVAV